MTSRSVGLCVCLLATLGCREAEPAADVRVSPREDIDRALPIEPEQASMPTAFPVALPALPIDLSELPSLEARPLPLDPLAGTQIRFGGTAGRRVALLGASMSAESPSRSELRLRLVNCDVQVVCPSLALEAEDETITDVALHFDRELRRDGELVPCVAPGQEFYAVASLARVPAPLAALKVVVEGHSDTLSSYVREPAYELEAVRLLDGRARIDAVADRSGSLVVSLVGHGPDGEPLFIRTLPVMDARPGEAFQAVSDPLPAGTSETSLTVLFEATP